MTDTREAILEELQTVLGSVSGIVQVWRDRGQIDEAASLPAIILLDGTERMHPDMLTHIERHSEEREDGGRHHGDGGDHLGSPRAEGRCH